MFHPTRGGVRGGRDQFTWDAVKGDKHRECYLGNSLNAPVGRWQEGRDLTWYAKSADALGNADQQKSIATAEMDERAREKAELKSRETLLLGHALAHGLGTKLPPHLVAARSTTIGTGEVQRAILQTLAADDVSGDAAPAANAGGIASYGDHAADKISGLGYSRKSTAPTGSGVAVVERLDGYDEGARAAAPTTKSARDNRSEPRGSKDDSHRSREEGRRRGRKGEEERNEHGRSQRDASADEKADRTANSDRHRASTTPLDKRPRERSPRPDTKHEARDSNDRWCSAEQNRDKNRSPSRHRHRSSSHRDDDDDRSFRRHHGSSHQRDHGSASYSKDNARSSRGQHQHGSSDERHRHSRRDDSPQRHSSRRSPY